MDCNALGASSHRSIEVGHLKKIRPQGRVRLGPIPGPPSLVAVSGARTSRARTQRASEAKSGTNAAAARCSTCQIGQTAHVSRNQVVFAVVIAAVVLVWWAVASDTPVPAETSTDAALRFELAAGGSSGAVHSAQAEVQAPRVAAAEADTPTAVAANPSPSASPETEIPVPDPGGPIAELSQLYASEPRASGSQSVESVIEAHFRRTEVPTGLLKSVLCRTTVCRIETRWSPERAQGFMSAMMHLVTEPVNDRLSFDHHLAIAPEAANAPDGTRTIEVYVRLQLGSP